MSGWIEHAGGECPVTLDSLVSVRFRDGAEASGHRAGHWIEGTMDWWKHDGYGDGDHSCDIIAYRLTKARPQ